MPTMEITTTVGCTLACTFCPQDKLLKAYKKGSDKVMSMRTFESILSKVPKHVRINFSGLSEPWLNPLATEMLQKTLEQGRPVAIYTTLQNMSLSDAIIVKSLLEKFEPQISLICLHLPDQSMNMRGYKPSDAFPEVLKTILSVADGNIFPRGKLEVMTMDGSGQVHEDVAHIVQNLPAWQGHTRAGNISKALSEKIVAMPTPRHDFSITCGKTPFYDHNVVMPNGDVLLCCMDYSLDNIIGNILETDYWDLFSSPALQKLRILNQKPEFSSDSICKSCTTAVKVVPYYEPYKA